MKDTFNRLKEANERARTLPPDAACANPHCSNRVPYRVDFCRTCHLEQQRMRRALQAKRR